MNWTSMLGFNRFARFFQQARDGSDIQDSYDDQKENSQGVSQEELDLPTTADLNTMITPDAGLTYIGIQFEQYFGDKRGRVGKYREMSLFPEISDAIDAICDEAIIKDPKGNIVNLQINEEMPEHIEEQVRDIWNNLVKNAYGFNEFGWDMFRKWLVEGELYVENILNDEGDEIIGIKILPSFTMLPVFSQNKIKSYLQIANRTNPATPTDIGLTSQKSGQIVFDKDQVSYVNYGLQGENAIDVRGFLEAAIRTYNQLRNLEDSLVVYRLVRAPERRIWNIAVGKMPKGKAEEYIKGLIQRYKKRIIYDPDTGAMNSSQNIQAMTEDFWFAKNEAGEGTTVEPIGGGMNLGEIEDINYFLRKLYKIIKLPSSRWQDTGSSLFSSGKSGEIQREEIKFSRFIERLRERFKYLLLNSFMTALKLKNIDDRYIDMGIYNVTFNESNLFKEYKELESLETKFSVFGGIWPYVYRSDNETGFLSQEFAIKKYLMISDEDLQWNKELLEMEKSKIQEGGLGSDEEASAEESGFGEEPTGGEESGLGGGGGGGDAGLPEVPEEAPTETPEVEIPEVPAGAPTVAPEAFDFSNTKGKILLEDWSREDKNILGKYRFKSQGKIVNGQNKKK
jgi:hypothetical protein